VRGTLPPQNGVGTTCLLREVHGRATIEASNKAVVKGSKVVKVTVLLDTTDFDEF
jgi:hypothetical protein